MQPRLGLRLEGAAVFAAATAGYLHVGGPLLLDHVSSRGAERGCDASTHPESNPRRPEGTGAP